MLGDAGEDAAELAEAERPGDQAADDLDLPFAGDRPDGALEAHHVDRFRSGAPVAIIAVVSGLYGLIRHTKSENPSYLRLQCYRLTLSRIKRDSGKSNMMSNVLVTGGSGFLGSHLVLKLLDDGHHVRATVRSAGKEAALRDMLRNGGQEPGPRLAIFEADLTDDRGWESAVAGCDYVLHAASPFPPGAPENEDELIVPARDGTLRVLRAARDAGVRRVVVTSSFAAIGYGHGKTDKLFTEEDWTDIRGADVQPYIKSKTIAERAAWDFIAREGGDLELTVINPVGIFGPVLGPEISSSIAIVKRLLEGMPAVPRIYFGMVDVRDLATLEVAAMQADVARDQRLLAIGGDTIALLDVAAMLRRRLGVLASRVPTRQVPDWLIRAKALFDPQAKAILPQLGIIRRSTAEKAHRLLDWQPRPYEATVADTAESLIRHRIITPQ